MSIQADAWFILRGSEEDSGSAELVRESIRLSPTGAGEVLVAPIYGSMEANVGHAIARSPIDVCQARGCERAVIGNGGVGRILEVGRGVKELREGQHVMFVGMDPDRWGYPERVMGYDAEITGIMSTRIKLRPDDVVPIPDDAGDLLRWAPFNVRYLTAWENWRMAYGTLRLQLTDAELPVLNVWSWGGGTGLAEVQLGSLLGHRGVAIASRDDRLDLAERLGVSTVDRRSFLNLGHDPARYGADRVWTSAYRDAERAFLETVRDRTDGEGVHVFVDFIGTPVFRATVKALARHGVVTTAGWRSGTMVAYHRAVECIQRHQFVHTHFIRRTEAFRAIDFAVEHNWFPEVDERIWSFDEIPEMVTAYLDGDFRMFPCYQINPVSVS